MRIEDPFLIEEILLNFYGHLGKWYRVESYTFENDILYIDFIFSSLDDYSFGRISVSLNYQKEVVHKIITTGSTYYQNSRLLDNDCVVSVYWLDGVIDTFPQNIKQFIRNRRIDSLISNFNI